MIGPGVGQRRHPQLSNAPKSLELGGVDQVEEQCVLIAVDTKRDDIVDRVADKFFGHVAMLRTILRVLTCSGPRLNATLAKCSLSFRSPESLLPCEKPGRAIVR